MTEKYVDIGDLLNASMFQNKKILEIAKMLQTIKDTVSFTGHDADPVMDSKEICLISVDKKRKRGKFKKELAEKNKNLDQLLSECCEEVDRCVSSGSGTEDYDIDDVDMSKSLN